MNGGDLTRSTFRSYQHYSGVRMQQGRVQLEAVLEAAAPAGQHGHAERAALPRHDLGDPGGGAVGNGEGGQGGDGAVHPRNIDTPGRRLKTRAGRW